jgi:hypothetical protein
LLGRLFNHILIVQLPVPKLVNQPVFIPALDVPVPVEQVSYIPPLVSVWLVIAAGYVPTPGLAKFKIEVDVGLFSNL